MKFLDLSKTKNVLALWVILVMIAATVLITLSVTVVIKHEFFNQEHRPCTTPGSASSIRA